MSMLTDTYWPETLILNATRVLSATVTLTVLFLLARLVGLVSPQEAASTPLISIVFMPAVLLTTGLFVVMVFRVLGSMGVPFMTGPAGLMALVMVVFIAVGDPLIWLIRKYYPRVVPLETFKIINPRALILVEKPVA